jgi:Bacterial Ig-like domain
MFRKTMSIIKSSAVLVTATFALLQIQGCGGGGGGGVTPNSPTSQQVDTSKPTVISTTPAQNGVAVGTNSAITMTFNEPIDSATVNSQTFTVMEGGTTPVTGSITSVGTTALFRPTGNLLEGASYTATVTTGVKDLAGNALAANYTWDFTTPKTSTTGTTTDTTPPTVLSTFPTINSGAVAMNTAIAVTFSEAIDPSTINTQNLILMKDGSTPVAGSVTYFGTAALFIPAGNLSAGASYTATVTTMVKDLAGNSLAANYSWNFTTASTSDLQAPLVLSVSPPDSATNVTANSPLVVTFNEAIMPFDFGLIDGRPVAVTFNDTYTTVTMTPTVALHPGSTYTSLIRQKDMAGNQMSEAFTWHFATSP